MVALTIEGRLEWQRVKISLKADAVKLADALENIPSYRRLCEQVTFGVSKREHTPDTASSLSSSPSSSSSEAALLDSQFGASADLVAKETPSLSEQRLRKPIPSPIRDYSALRWTRSLPEMTKVGKFQQWNIGLAPYELDENVPIDLILPFREARVLLKTGVARLYILDDDFVLKVMRPDVDVDSIVRNMVLARTVAPVPYVYLAGREFNCTYILMEYIKAPNLMQRMRRDLFLDIGKVTPQIEWIVDRLASVNLAHNDLYPQNVLVDKDLNVVSVVDWDFSSRLSESDEYQVRAVQDAYAHDWDGAFRKYHSPAVLFHGYRFQGSEFDARWMPELRVRRVY